MGKTHLAVALGLKAIEHGYGVYFVRAHQLLEDLRRAQAENRLERRMRVYLAPKGVFPSLKYLLPVVVVASFSGRARP